MVPATLSVKDIPGPFIVSLDVGSSSVRTLLFDGKGNQVEGFGRQIPYRVNATPDGGVEIDAEALAGLTIGALSSLHQQLENGGIRPSAIAFSLFWHSFLGVGKDTKPTTPILHLLDTRSEPQVEELKRRIDPAAAHRRTGCVLHTSYWPGKLLWLYQNRPEACAATTGWVSFGEYLFGKLLGKPRTSTSMVSASGIWNQAKFDYDDELLGALPIRRDQLAPVSEFDEAPSSLTPEFAAQWPRLDGIPWFPALGDGACNSAGSGCVDETAFALMVGTTGAMRVTLERDAVEIPPGLWCYRLDRKRFVLGGALSNGGEVFAWMRRTLLLPEPEQLETDLATVEPGAHGVTVLPFFAGERSPYWRSDLRATFTGMTLASKPGNLVHAALESVALRFRQIYTMMSAGVGAPDRVIDSGGALLHSPAWTRMMADAIGRPLVPCLEREASSRGAALMALERLGAIGHLRDLPPRTGETVLPTQAREAVYEAMLAQQETLYRKLWQTA